MVIYMTTTKMTYATALDMVLAIEEVKANDELVEKLTALKTSVSKKASSKSGKPTAKQKANEEIKAKIIQLMATEPNRLFTISEICKIYTDEELSNQKVSSLMRQLVAEGKADRVEDKRKAYFSVK